MHLTAVSLPVGDPRRVSAFYRDILDVDVASSDTTAQVQLGSSLLELRRQQDVPPAHHLAFTIPRGKFAAAKFWLRERATLLTDGDGKDEFETSPSWNAHSVYFDGPEDSVLELIERRDLDNPTAGRFTASDLLTISEVGVAVPDVRAAARDLQERAGIAPYGNEPGENFAAVGDVHGLLILVSPGRTWFPTGDRRAGTATTWVQAAGGKPGSHPLAGSSVLRISRSGS